MRDWSTKAIEYVAGISVGVNPAKNAWAELGYNFEGFDDEDFDKSNFKRKGPYVDFRYKFNQDTINGDLPIRRKVNTKEEPKEVVRKNVKINSKSTTTKPTKKVTKKVIKKTEPELETIDDLFEQYSSKH